MVISSPVLMLANPTQASAATTTDNLSSVDSSGYHSTPRVPETASPSLISTPTTAAPPMSSQDSDFTIQAALGLTRATQTDNLVNSKTYYDISFRTTTAGVIKKIEMTFPPGTYAGIALLVEVVGIGPGTIVTSGATATGQTIPYTVTNAVNVPANTKIRIQVSNINNPPIPSSTLTVSITTRDSADAIIDGPTVTNVYNIKQIGTAEMADNAITVSKIANGAITSTKPAESYEKRVAVTDTNAGHAVGWDPNGATHTFTISESEVSGSNSAFVSVIVDATASTENFFCDTVDQNFGEFIITCFTAPPDGSILDYVVANLPSHEIG